MTDKFVIPFTGTAKLGTTLQDVTDGFGNDLPIRISSTTVDVDALTIAGSPVPSNAELAYIDIATLGTGAASKAVVLNADADYTYPATATIVHPSGATETHAAGSTLTVAGTFNASGTFQVGGVAVTSSAAELNILDGVTATAAELNMADISLQEETIDAGGVVSVTKKNTKIASTGAGAITLAAPDASMYGLVKTIEMISGEHDVTLALTNVQGGSAATTATFSDISDTLVLVAGALKWHVVGESGVVLS